MHAKLLITPMRRFMGSNSTFDVRLIDAAEEDLQNFREHFPVLAPVRISTSLLTPLPAPTAPLAQPGRPPTR